MDVVVTLRREAQNRRHRPHPPDPLRHHTPRRRSPRPGCGPDGRSSGCAPGSAI